MTSLPNDTLKFPAEHRPFLKPHLPGWCSMDIRSVARNKTIDTQPDGFLRILAEFSAEFKHLKGLARELKELLFPLRGGEIFTGTDLDQGDINRLYDGMIDIFNRSITCRAHKESL